MERGGFTSITNGVRGGLLIKIRYSDLQPGLHANAETEGKHTVVYLVPGLSATDRQSAIDRLRASAKVGHGPKLPAIPLALALIADRITVNSRNAVAAARLHPTGLAIPAVVLAGAGVLYALLVTVSIHMGLPATSALTLDPLPVASTPASPAPSHQVSAGGTHASGPAQASRLPGSPVPMPGRTAGHTAPGARPHPAGASPSPSQPSPTGVSTAPPSPSPSSTPPTISPSPRPSPSKTKGGGGKGHCLSLGLVHLCL